MFFLLWRKGPIHNEMALGAPVVDLVEAHINGASPALCPISLKASHSSSPFLHYCNVPRHGKADSSGLIIPLQCYSTKQSTYPINADF
eukprot:6914632-Ditylum_brightwellii.AAC.1